jgi:hypothetical protein
MTKEDITNFLPFNIEDGDIFVAVEKRVGPREI